MKLLILKQKFHGKERKISIFIFLFLVISTVLFVFVRNSNEINNFNEKNEPQYNNEITPPKISAKWYLNLTNYMINNTQHYHNATIPVIGWLQYINSTGISGYNISIIVDGVEAPKFNDTTDASGKFHINYTVPYSMNIYQTHKIEVKVIDFTPATIQLENHFIISVNATSDLDLEIFNLDVPQLAGGLINIPGYLRYDNNSGIPNATVDYYWYNNTMPQEKWPLNNFSTSLLDGSFQIPIPDDNLTNTIHLNLTYIGIPDVIQGSQKNISINLYRNITCIWNTVSSATEGNRITIRGQLFARNNSKLKINFTDIILRMGGASIGITTTNEEGAFELPYTIPGGFLGTNTIEVELLGYSYINSNESHTINIAGAPITPADDISSGGGSGDDSPPFFNFFLILIPIIVGVVAGFGIYAYFYLKKQEKEASLVKLPLEDRIRNLKILKDTGRLEESLSYLFQSIYMELINAKYGRIIKVNETIRDFAIISVKDLKLNPTTIYPFIQKVEEIIYARPFIINDKDFYITVELFSPIYFELTGYNFVLNF